MPRICYPARYPFCLSLSLSLLECGYERMCKGGWDGKHKRKCCTKSEKARGEAHEYYYSYALCAAAVYVFGGICSEFKADLALMPRKQRHLRHKWQNYLTNLNSQIGANVPSFGPRRGPNFSLPIAENKCQVVSRTKGLKEDGQRTNGHTDTRTERTVGGAKENAKRKGNSCDGRENETINCF